MRTLLATLLILGIVFPTFGQAHKGGQESVYDMLMHSTVFIASPIPTERGAYTIGSGSLISYNKDNKKFYVLTNYHVVTDLPKTFLFFPQYDSNGLVEDRRRYIDNISKPNSLAIPAKAIVKADSKDLAILEFTLPKDYPLAKDITPIALATKAPKPGDNVHTLGNPGAGSLWNYTKGNVRNQGSVKQIRAKIDATRVLSVNAKMLETSNPTNKGDSGGPLANDQGELVGVTQGGSVDANLLSTFIHMDEVKALLEANKIKPYVRPVKTASKTKPPEETKDSDAEKKVASEKKTDNSKAMATKEIQPQSLLRFAKERLEEGDKTEAMKTLQEIITIHGRTETAKEAKELLEKVKK